MSGFLVLRVSTVRRPSIPGSAASLTANIKTVACGISPIPPVSNALKAPRIDKKFHFLLRKKSQVPYAMGKETAINRMIEPTKALSSASGCNQFSRLPPNHSFPFLRMRIGKSRLKLRLINMFSLLGAEYGGAVSDIGRTVKHQHKIKSPLFLE